MSTATQTFALTFTQLNAIQPARTTPVDLISYTDSTPIMVSEGAVVVPAAGMTLSLPAGWSKITQVLIVNTDSTSYLNLQTATADILPPNGGMYNKAVAYNTSSGVPASYTAVPVVGGQTAATLYGTWVLRPVSVAGAYGALSATAYIWLAGF